MGNKINNNTICFVKKAEGYEQITYSEYCQRCTADTTYSDKKFIFLYGMLLEVSESDYIDFYKQNRRNKYLSEQSIKRGDLLFSSLTSDKYDLDDILVDTDSDTFEQVSDKLLTERLHRVLSFLRKDEKVLIYEYFFLGMEQVELARKYGKSQSTISRKIHQIVLKLKFFMEN